MYIEFIKCLSSEICAILEDLDEMVKNFDSGFDVLSVVIQPYFLAVRFFNVLHLHANII